MLTLTKPLVFIDLEATGVDRENDRIVEIAILKVFPDGTKENKTKRVNPTIPIPPAATEIHRISDEDVKDCPKFSQIAVNLHEYIKGCDLAGFNSNAYDIPMLFNEFIRCGINLDYKSVNLIDVGNIFKINEPRTLTAGYKFYCGKDLEDAHSAEADINATYEVFMAQLSKYPELPKTLEELAIYSNFDRRILDLSGKFCEDADGNILLNFGKYRGEKALDHLDFIEWMLYKADFPADTNKVCEQLLQEAYGGPF